jgi:hypothetical protein
MEDLTVRRCEPAGEPPGTESALPSVRFPDGPSDPPSPAEPRPSWSRRSRSMSDDLAERASPRVGRLLDEKWRLERLLGVGGMAAVYAARHRNGARAAVKILHPELAREGEVRTRFLQEGYAANKVEHPGAVQVLDDDVVKGGDDDGAAYIVMELLEGESLLDRARRNAAPLPEAEVLAIAEGVLEVLEAAHAHGIVHRDLKPENLFLVRPSTPPPALDSVVREPPVRVKVLDFGIARIADGGGRTRVGTALGTPSYMAPEQAKGRRDEIDGRTDLFALGATMFRVLTGRRVHDADTAPEILAKMATLPAPPVRSVAPEVSETLASIIDRALRFARADRYADAKAMREDVRAAREGRALPSREDVSPAAVTGEMAVPGPATGFSAGGEPTGFRQAKTVVERAVGGDDSPVSEVVVPSLPTRVELPQAVGMLAPEVTAIPPTAPSPMLPAAPPAKSKTGVVLVAALASLVLVGGGVAVFALGGGDKAGAVTGPATDEEKGKSPSKDPKEKKPAQPVDESDDESAASVSASAEAPASASVASKPTSSSPVSTAKTAPKATTKASSPPMILLAPTATATATATPAATATPTATATATAAPTATAKGKPPKDKGKGKGGGLGF